VRRISDAIARALDVLVMHGPVELLRRALVALLLLAMRGWWP
jgi:hypothetical protein